MLHCTPTPLDSQPPQAYLSTAKFGKNPFTREVTVNETISNKQQQAELPADTHAKAHDPLRLRTPDGGSRHHLKDAKTPSATNTVVTDGHDAAFG